MKPYNLLLTMSLFFGCAFLLIACQPKATNTSISSPANSTNPSFLNPPLIKERYFADPSAHVFNNKLYIYPSHDIESDPSVKGVDLFNMKDYRILSMESPQSEVIDHGPALTLENIPWAKRQLWAPDATEKNGRYYLFFPAKDQQDIFRIGVATSNSPTGPFTAEPNPIKNSFSIDPSIFKDDDGSYYLYFGGIMGGQLQSWVNGKFEDTEAQPAADQPALHAKIARMSDNLLEFTETPRDLHIVDKNGKLLLSGDKERRFFEAAWVHKHKGKYYFSYSTGDTHFIAYAIGDNPYGPYTYQGIILMPVLGWTNHHSITEFKGKWYLFYHDSFLSGGQTHLRNIKMTELTHNPDGSIRTIDAYFE